MSKKPYTVELRLCLRHEAEARSIAYARVKLSPRKRPMAMTTSPPAASDPASGSLSKRKPKSCVNSLCGMLPVTRVSAT